MSFYGTLQDAADYHMDRGNHAWVVLSQDQQTEALTRGSDYIDQRYRKRLRSGRWESLFPGTRTAGRTQDREWPRIGAKDYEGAALPDDEVPAEVIRASYEAALREAQAPGSLSPDYIPSEQVIRETVGPITVQYAAPKDGSMPNRPVIPMIDEIIAPVLTVRFDLPGVMVV